MTANPFSLLGTGVLVRHANQVDLVPPCQPWDEIKGVHLHRPRHIWQNIQNFHGLSWEKTDKNTFLPAPASQRTACGPFRDLYPYSLVLQVHTDSSLGSSLRLHANCIFWSPSDARPRLFCFLDHRPSKVSLHWLQM